jgi:hypothetical protein
MADGTATTRIQIKDKLQGCARFGSESHQPIRTFGKTFFF